MKNLKVMIFFLSSLFLLSFSVSPQDSFLNKKIAYLKKDLKDKEERIKNLEEKYVYLEKILKKKLEIAYMKIKYLKKKLLEKEKTIEKKEEEIKNLNLLLKKINFAIEKLLKKAKSSF